MKKNEKKGSIIVEASIFFPIFFIGILTLAYLVKVMWIQEDAFFAFEQEARELAKRSYAVETLANGEGVLFNSFPLLVKSKVYEVQPKDVQKVKITDFQYRFWDRGMSDLISASLEFEVKVKMPIPFYDRVHMKDSLLFRAFVGAETENNPIPFEEMEKEKVAHPVWVFPKAGERYHKETCNYITNRPRQVLLTHALRNKYDGCNLCDADTLLNGNIVYCFTRSGKVFHRGSCSSVERYVMMMEKEKAEEKGYTPCMECGG